MLLPLKTWKNKAELALLVIVFLLMLRSLMGNMYWPDGRVNQHVLQAEAWLEGSLFVENAGHDIANFQDKYVVVYPPFPTVIVVPFVATFGAELTKPVVLAFLFFCLSYLCFSESEKSKR